MAATQDDQAIISGEKFPDFGRYNLRLEEMQDIVANCRSNADDFLFNLVTTSYALGFIRGNRASQFKRAE